jgi:RNA polymerase sigma-70 factor, ECF subfamily
MSDDFGYIYDQYIARIYRFIFLKTPSHEVAEDVCSDVFVRAYKQFKKAHITNMQAFLYQVARRTLADYYEKEGKRYTIPFEVIEDLHLQDTLLFEEAMVRSDMEEVRKAIVTLHDEYQNLIIWRYLDELSIPEIAAIEGRSEGSIRVGLHRAMESLRKKMIGRYEDKNVLA